MAGQAGTGKESQFWTVGQFDFGSHGTRGGNG
jgi:hypothetical protein